MSDIKNINLKFNCQEKDSLQKTDGGFNCAKCAKKVVDFRNASDKDLQKALKSGSQVCGVYHKSQLSKQFLRYAAVATIATGSFQLQAQSDTIPEIAFDHSEIQDTTESEIFVGMVMDTMAEPIGGMKSFYESLKNNLIIPENLTEPGKVFVQFEVDTAGNMINHKVIKGVNEELDQEALNALKRLNPKFTPGTQRGEPVKVRMVIPVFFDPKK